MNTRIHTPNSDTNPQQPHLPSDVTQSRTTDINNSEAAHASTEKIDTQAISSPLTSEERSRKDQIEKEVIRASIDFLLKAHLLEELRNKKLYRETHLTFESYCECVFEFTGARASQLIAAANEYNDLRKHFQETMLPSTEAALREIRKVPAKNKKAVLEDASKAGSQRPTAKAIETAWSKLREEDTNRPANSSATKAAQILKSLEKIVASLGDANMENFTIGQLNELKRQVSTIVSFGEKIPTAA